MITDKIKNTFREAKQAVHRGQNLAAGIGGDLEKKVVFESFKGTKYSDNPRAISEKLHELYPDYDIVWGLPEDYDREAAYVPDYVRTLPVNTKWYRKERATAIAYVRNECMTDDLYKRPGQLFLQTWHGDRGIKKILFESLEDRGVSADKFGYYDHVITDYFVTGSEYAIERIKSAFHYNGKVFNVGCPRNDCLITPENPKEAAAREVFEAEVKRRIGVDPDKKLLLYAPTLRRGQKVVEGAIDIDETLEHFDRKDGDWICLVRAHPKSPGVTVSNPDSVIDVSNYPDMSDLLMIADCLITDYSSCAGDFILRRKPLFLVQFDYEDYIREDRTFHVDIEKIGYLIAKTPAELYDRIDAMTDEDYAANCEKILDYYKANETGHASESVCRLIDKAYRRYENKRK